MKNNDLRKLYGELTQLNCLRSLNLRHNNIKNSGIPPELFDLEELTTLDLSHNNLDAVPEGLEKVRSLLVLNLSNNQYVYLLNNDPSLTHCFPNFRIEAIPSALFIHLTDLLFLDLSDNRLETLPPQTRRLANLQTLILSNNPLELFQLRQLPSLQNLEVLHMRNTQRNLHNFPTSLDSLSNLCELDLSQNNLPKIPDCVYNVPNLKRLNLSDNEITELSNSMESWTKLETLNLSRNALAALPPALCKLASLRRIYLNDNKLNFDGIPSGIGKLSALEVFSASNNELEMIPESLCRCGALKKLNLSSNKLITLPEAIHLYTDLEQLDLRNNPNLVMPPKPVEMQKGSGVEFYNIDFSLQHQLRLAGATVPPQVQAAAAANSPKDPMARKLRLRRGVRPEVGQADSAKVLKGMKDIADEKHANGWCEELGRESLKPKRWDETLEKPPVDYSEIFEEEDGQLPGLTIWEIENFLPNRIEDVAHGKFYEGDCYIVLKTYVDDHGQLGWEIYFWIGNATTLDKKACAAIHAVNLRNYLGARCRTIREEQGDESDEFHALFDTELCYIEGGRTSTGFFTVEDVHHITRLYRVHAKGASLHLEPVNVDVEELDPRFVFLLDNNLQIFIWYGKQSKNTLKSRARFVAEKINKNERKGRSELFTEFQGSESKDFLKAIGYDESDYEPENGDSGGDRRIVVTEHVSDAFVPFEPRLYQVQLGMGYLELPQVELPENKLTETLLNSKHVYILDAFCDLFVWFGKKSTRLVRAAAIKLGQELFGMIKRPPHALVTRLQEGTETQVFKCKFVGWDEIIAVDFTRTAQSVARTGADLTKWAKQQETKADLAALFMPRQPTMPLIEAAQLEDDWNYDLEAMESFVLENKKFVRLPDEELGHFYSDECYVFLCRYCIPAEDEDEEEEDEEEGAKGDGANGRNGGRKKELPPEDEIQCIVYFWQGRNAGNMGWLTFTFTLQKKFKSMFGEELEVMRIHQQQENLKFMSHFKRKFVIHQGRRKQKQLAPDGKQAVRFFQLRSNGSALCTRLLQVTPDAGLLNSEFW